MKETAEERKQ